MTATIDYKKTQRGFWIGEFQDANGEKCSIQESSAIREEGLLWLGIIDVLPKMFIPGFGWQEIKLPKPPPNGHVMTAGRMHLTQSQVALLLPALQYFAEHGELPGMAF